MIIWFASGNLHKKKELCEILSSHLASSIDIKIPKDAGLDFNPEETGNTFLENSFIKALALYKMVKEPVIADDSGICVDALDGKPGVYSARYGGEHLNDKERNSLLLSELGESSNRNARFVCAMVLYLNPDKFFLAQETMDGLIVSSAAGGRGSGGFGYDPVLFIPEMNCTVAELNDEDKNRLSHRGKAARAIAKFLPGSINGR